MSTFVLIPGAGGAAWYWHRVVPLLEQAGDEALAVDLPGDDAQAGPYAYADRVIAAIGKCNDVILVAQSMGAFTAALVSARTRTPIRMLVFVNAMIPLPGETAGEWWEHTGWLEARTAAAKRGGYNVEFDISTYFLHDVPKGVAEEGAAHELLTLIGRLRCLRSTFALPVICPLSECHPPLACGLRPRPLIPEP